MAALNRFVACAVDHEDALREREGSIFSSFQKVRVSQYLKDLSTG
jgi:hypothetical protein